MTRYWLALTRLKGVGREALGLLAASEGAGVESLFKRPRSLAKAGLDTELIESARAFKGWDEVDREIGLAQKSGVRLIAFPDPEYPMLLRETASPPALLYAKGGRLEGDAVAVIGTRRPSYYGAGMASAVAAGLAAAGVAVVSGLARGCDTAAHRGALDAGGFTVAVLGCGIDVVYPSENVRLYAEVAQKGLLISEYPFSTPPLPHNFLQRNRIISGLSRAVVVAEAPLRSGALMTARLALEAGRDVMAVPGQATASRCRGSNRLIKEGAALVESALDVIEALGLSADEASGNDKGADGAQSPGEAGPKAVSAAKGKAVPVRRDASAVDAGGLMPEEKSLLKCIGGSELHIDEITARTGIPSSRAGALLLELEIKGLIAQRPGMVFVRRF